MTVPKKKVLMRLKRKFVNRARRATLPNPPIAGDILMTEDGGAIKDVIARICIGALPIFALPFVFVLLSLILQRAVLFSPSKLKPKLSKISPISNAKQKYGGNGMVEFGKRFAKLIFITVIAGLFFTGAFFTLPSLSAMPALMLMEEIKDVTVTLLFYMIGAMAVLTLIDLPYGQFAHLKKLRMSLQEIRDENKDSEGDPHMKGERRARARAISQGTMMRDVASADVHDIPIHSDPPCARSLHATVDIGETIRPEHFAAVAAAIHFADQLKPKTY